MITTNEIENKLANLKQLENIISDYENEADSLRDELKQILSDMGTEELVLSNGVIRYTTYLSTRFDTRRFKAAFGEKLYLDFTKQIEGKRFMVA